MELRGPVSRPRFGFQFNENTAYFFDIFVLPNQVFVTQQVAESEPIGLSFGLTASVERAILGPQLLGRIAGHPEGFLIDHFGFAPEERFANRIRTGNANPIRTENV